VFTPTASDGLDDANLVGRLDSVVGTETAGKSDEFQVVEANKHELSSN